MQRPGLIRAYDSQLQIAQRFADALIIIVCVRLAVYLRGIDWNDHYTIAAIAGVALFYLFAKMTNLYQSHRIAGIMGEVKPLLASWLASVAGLMALAYALKVSADFSRIVVGVVILLVPAALLLWRWAVRRTLMWFRGRGYNTRATVIVGINETARELAQSILDRPWSGLNLLGFIDPGESCPGAQVELEGNRSRPVIGDLEYLYRQARDAHIDIVYVAVPLSDRDMIDGIMKHLGDTTVSMFVVPDIYTAGIMQGHWVTIGTVPTISVIDDPVRGVGSWLKRVEDIVISLLVLVVMAVPMLLIAIGIKLTSKGPVLYVQKRYGLNCEPIAVYKFRTMTVTENDDEFTQARPGDPRVTRFGAFLRRTSMDELPQFFNVLGGTMSVVGPRPHPVALNEEFRGRVNAYTMRHKIKPGITGLAQVNGLRGQTQGNADMEARIRRDIEYINGWSVWVDLRIIFRTPLVLLKGENAH